MIKRPVLPLMLLTLASIFLFFLLNLLLGSVHIPLRSVWNILWGNTDESVIWQNIIWKSRVPQALTALVAGAGLSVSGLQMQTVFRNPLAGVGFGIGALSMVGFPMLSGFISKLLFATSALDSQDKMLPTLFVLALSTLLNAVYFLRLMITLYSRRRPEDKPLPEYTKAGNFWGLKFSIVCFIILNLVLGMYSQPIVQAITDGLAMFD